MNTCFFYKCIAKLFPGVYGTTRRVLLNLKNIALKDIKYCIELAMILCPTILNILYCSIILEINSKVI